MRPFVTDGYGLCLIELNTARAHDQVGGVAQSFAVNTEADSKDPAKPLQD